MGTDPLASRISAIASKLENHDDSPLTRSLPYIKTCYHSSHHSMASGEDLPFQTFRYLFDALLRPKYPNVPLYGNAQACKLEPGQRAYRLRLQHTQYGSKMICSSIQEFTGGSNVVSEYRLRNTYGTRNKDADEILEGVPTWKMQLHVHQVSLEEAFF